MAKNLVIKYNKKGEFERLQIAGGPSLNLELSNHTIFSFFKRRVPVLFGPERYTCMRFFVLVFCTYRTNIGQIIRLLNNFDFVLEFANLYEFFNIQRWLSWREVSFLVNWANAKWDSTSTESTQNDKIFVNVGVFCVDSVDVKPHSALTQLTWVSLRVDSVDGESDSALTQCEGDDSSQNRHT